MIAVFIDSNSLFAKPHRDFSKIWVHEKLDAYVDMIESADLYDYVKLVIPEIVFGELHRQQIESFKNATNDLQGFAFPTWRPDYEANLEDYKKWLNSEHQSLISHGKRGMVALETAEVSGCCFESIIERALDKRAPFEGKDKHSDKGFKDVLIWETILEYKRGHSEDNIIWLSRDKRLHDASLQCEYKNEFHEEITICGNKQEFEEALNQAISTLNIDAKPQYTSNRESKIDKFLRSTVFDNMQLILEVGNLSYASDTKYRLESFVLIDDEGKQDSAWATLWVDAGTGEIESCKITFEIMHTDEIIACRCFVNDTEIHIEYEADEIEGIAFES